MATDLPPSNVHPLLRYFCSRCTNYTNIENKEGDTLNGHIEVLKERGWRIDYSQYPTRLLVCDVCENLKYVATIGDINGLHLSVAIIENALLTRRVKGRVTEFKKAQLKKRIQQWKDALNAIYIPVLSRHGRELAVKHAERQKSALLHYSRTQLMTKNHTNTLLLCLRNANMPTRNRNGDNIPSTAGREVYAAGDCVMAIANFL